nr:DNA translocase FtsK [Pseudomonas defluvii]
MKLEHRDIIARAQLHGCLPSEIAGELLEHDLVNLVIDQIPNFRDWSENTQQLTIERVTLGVKDSVQVAIRTIAANGVVTIPVDIKRVQVDAKHMTVTATVDGKDPKKHDLVDHAGHLCLLVMAPDSYDEGLDAITPDRDQKEFPLHVSDLTGSLFSEKIHGSDKQEDQELPEGPDPLYEEALTFVRDTRRPSISAVQRHLKVGYNRAARMLEQMEAEGVVTPINSTGAREVIAQAELDALVNEDRGSSPETLISKEFGDFDYDDAKQLIVLKANGKPFKAHWVQSRLAISSEQVTTLLVRLLDDKVIEVEAEGESALDHSYKVVATLEDVVA